MIWTRVCTWVVLTAIVLVVLVTLGINIFTLSQIRRAKTSVPWWDEWSFLQDFQAYEKGRPLSSILWTPYWGHRLVIPRLLFFANARWCSLGSFTWFTLIIQFAHLALLIGLAWRLFGAASRSALALAIAVIFNLMLSPFQMENFTWNMQPMFSLVFLAASSSFVCLALTQNNRHHSVFLALCIAAGLVASYTMPNGLLVWPLLVVEAMWLKLRRRHVVFIAILGTFVILTYFWKYERPPMGMGVIGIARDPLHAILLLGSVLAGPLNLLSRTLGPLLCILVLIIVGWEGVRAIGSHSRLFSVLVTAILFAILSTLSIIVGRLDPRWLTEDLAVPERYYTMINVFWSFVMLFGLYTCWQRRRKPIVLAIYGIIFFLLMFGRIPFQLIKVEDWADFFRGVDATGSALILDAPDEQYLSILWPNKMEFTSLVAFLREHRMAMFHEPRASWPGRPITELFRTNDGIRCSGAIEAAEPLKGFWRVQGWAWDLQSEGSPGDILLVDASGRVIGLARGGLRHGYLPGFPAETHPTTNSHASFRHSEWFGYVEQQVGTDWRQLIAYGVLPDGQRVCRIG